MRVALIGFGATGRAVAERVRAGEAGDHTLTGVLVRDPARYGDHATRTGLAFVATLTDLLTGGPDLVAELGGHEALRSHGEAVLRSGRTLLTISAGALADDDLRERLLAAASDGAGHVLLPSGAIGGLDIIGAASVIGIDRIRHVVRKPPGALLDADEARELVATGRPRELYVGMAREAIRLFPANVNVVAMVSMAGVGFDRTEVVVVADPGVTHNTHEVTATGPFGSIELRVENVPSAENPKTGVIVAGSIVRTLRRLSESVVVGA